MAAFFVVVEVKRAILTSAHNGSPGRSPSRSVHAIIIMQSRIDRDDHGRLSRMGHRKYY